MELNIILQVRNLCLYLASECVILITQGQAEKYSTETMQHIQFLCLPLLLFPDSENKKKILNFTLTLKNVTSSFINMEWRPALIMAQQIST